MYRFILLILSLFVMLAGCSGVQTFPNVARAGDTVSIAMGWQKKFNHSNTTVTITPSIGDPIVYLPDDPAIRAIINLYPDPLSNIVIGTALENNIYFKSGYSYGSLINANYTSGDTEWWQTVAFVDLPSNLPEGATTIELINNVGEVAVSVIDVESGQGNAEPFNVEGNGPLEPIQLASLERASSFEVSFLVSVMPYSIEMEFSHIGEVYIENPSNKKNIIWSSNGSILKIYLMPASTEAISNIHDYKFYVSGTAALGEAQDIQPLTLNYIKAYDKDGVLIDGVSVSMVGFLN